MQPGTHSGGLGSATGVSEVPSTTNCALLGKQLGAQRKTKLVPIAGFVPQSGALWQGQPVPGISAHCAAAGGAKARARAKTRVRKVRMGVVRSGQGSAMEAPTRCTGAEIAAPR